MGPEVCALLYLLQSGCSQVWNTCRIILRAWHSGKHMAMMNVGLSYGMCSASIAPVPARSMLNGADGLVEKMAHISDRVSWDAL